MKLCDLMLMKFQIFRCSASGRRSIKGKLMFVLTVFAIAGAFCVPVIGSDASDESAATWNENGTSLYSQSKYSEALQAFDKAIELDSKVPQIWYNKGNVLYSQGKYDGAITAYDKVVELDPTYAYAWFSKGKALNHLKKYVEAIQCFNKSIELNPRDSEAWYNKGCALLKLSKNDEAILSLDKVIEIDPKNANAWYDKGYALYIQDKYDEAIEAFDNAIEIDPQRASAWHQKGVALAEQGKFDEAIRAYDEAIRIDPNFEDAWYNKGFALQNQGKNLEATITWIEALQKSNSTYKSPQAANATKSIPATLAPATVSASATEAHVSWQKTFGGSDMDWASSVQQTTDGGYIIAGTTASYGARGYDAWLIKTDSSGNELWNRTFNRQGFSSDSAKSVQQTIDGGYIIAGNTDVAGSPGIYTWLNAWQIKTDAEGKKLWDKTCGERIISNNSVQTTDGEYIIAGMTESYGAGNWDAWLVKTDANGNV